MVVGLATAFTLLLLVATSIAIPGIRLRNAVKNLRESEMKLTAYETQLGPPTYRFENLSEFKASDLHNIFAAATSSKHLSYACWAKEGLPYYCILIAYDPETNEVHDLQVKLLW